MGALRRSYAWLTCALLIGLAGAAAGEIYKWTDASGQVHFTQDLRQVPVDQRSDAEVGAKQKARSSRVQIYSAPPAKRSAASRSLSSRSGIGGSTGQAFLIRVQPSGNSLAVNVRINGQMDVPFHIDTGATDVVLPAWAAKQLGLDLSDARTGVYGTANGIVEQKLVTLESVAMGGARIENVPATVSESMQHGLLGLSYFNHFQYSIDPVKGLVRLQHNDLEESGVLKGGRSRAQWKQQFAAAHARIRAMEQLRDEVPFSKTRTREARAEEIERLHDELKKLESEADDARVPFSWRE